VSARLGVRGHSPALELAGVPGRYGDVEVVADPAALLDLGDWRGAWPAAAELWELPDAAGDRVLVVGPPEVRFALVARLEDRVAVAEAGELSRPALAAATVVVVAREETAPPAREAAAVLGAGRVLVAPRAEPAGGLQAGVDHLAYGSHDEGADLAAEAAGDPAAFALVRAFGREVARAYRADRAWPRIARTVAA
jgi:hypothetical protein